MYEIKDKNLTDLINSLKEIDDIVAVALGGSRVLNNNDEMSDYDLYIYATRDITYDEREKALSPHCNYTEICNHYWESEDNVVMNNGTPVDIIYRTVDMFRKYLQMVVKNGNAFNGYTTCFWHNIVTCQVLFDKTGEFTKLKEEADIPYPENLRKNIISNNRKLLEGYLPSYDKQIKKAYERNDIVSNHHRITEFLASYFDIIFAYNKVLHPGEKRLVTLAKKYCKTLPDNFEDNINKLLTSVGTGKSYDIVTDMINELDKNLNR